MPCSGAPWWWWGMVALPESGCKLPNRHTIAVLICPPSDPLCACKSSCIMGEIQAPDLWWFATCTAIQTPDSCTTSSWLWSFPHSPTPPMWFVFMISILNIVCSICPIWLWDNVCMKSNKMTYQGGDLCVSASEDLMFYIPGRVPNGWPKSAHATYKV